MRPWTHAEEEALVMMAHLGIQECAKAFERSPQSIKIKAMRLGVSLKRRRFGTKLEPSSPATLRRVRELSLANLCPACGKRPIGVKSTGLCAYCHLHGLADVHEEKVARIEGQRELWAARSKLRRRRQAEAATS